jgi:hypothetical protein
MDNNEALWHYVIPTPAVIPTHTCLMSSIRRSLTASRLSCAATTYSRCKVPPRALAVYVTAHALLNLGLSLSCTPSAGACQDPSLHCLKPPFALLLLLLLLLPPGLRHASL